MFCNATPSGSCCTIPQRRSAGAIKNRPWTHEVSRGGMSGRKMNEQELGPARKRSVEYSRWWEGCKQASPKKSGKCPAAPIGGACRDPKRAQLRFVHLNKIPRKAAVRSTRRRPSGFSAELVDKNRAGHLRGTTDGSTGPGSAGAKYDYNLSFTARANNTLVAILHRL